MNVWKEKYSIESLIVRVHERIEKAKSIHSWKKLEFYFWKFVRAFKDCKRWVFLRFPPPLFLKSFTCQMILNNWEAFFQIQEALREVGILTLNWYFLSSSLFLKTWRGVYGARIYRYDFLRSWMQIRFLNKYNSYSQVFLK